MNVCLALCPQESDGLLELTLEASDMEFLYFENMRTKEQAQHMQVMILDPDLPGRDFLIRYRKLHSVIGNFPLIVLGSPSHVTMDLIPWDSNKTYFLQGHDVLQKLESVLIQNGISTKSSQQKNATIISPKVIQYEETVELFKGLDGVQLPDILQMLCLSRWTGEIRVHNKIDHQLGRIYLAAGILQDSATDMYRGESACFEILSWKKSAYHFLENVLSPNKTVQASWEAILMESAYRSDISNTTLASLGS